MITVLVVDDQDLFRSGIAGVIGTADDMRVVGEAANGEEAVVMSRATDPDVVLMDIRMPVLNGIEATRRIRTGEAAPRVLVLTTFDLDEHVFDALRAGASGFLLKDVRPEQLLDAVRVISDGGSLLAPTVTGRLMRAFASGTARVSRRLPDLTPREQDVLLGVARGRSNQQIAAELFIGQATVKTYVSRLLMKIGGNDRVHLVIAAYEAGLA